MDDAKVLENECLSRELAQTEAEWQEPVKKAASLGFEPRQRDPESLVLPLHYEAFYRGF